MAVCHACRPSTGQHWQTSSARKRVKPAAEPPLFFVHQLTWVLREDDDKLSIFMPTLWRQSANNTNKLAKILHRYIWKHNWGDSARHSEYSRFSVSIHTAGQFGNDNKTQRNIDIETICSRMLSSFLTASVSLMCRAIISMRINFVFFHLFRLLSIRSTLYPFQCETKYQFLLIYCVSKNNTLDFW